MHVRLKLKRLKACLLPVVIIAIFPVYDGHFLVGIQLISIVKNVAFLEIVMTEHNRRVYFAYCIPVDKQITISKFYDLIAKACHPFICLSHLTSDAEESA